MYVDPYRFAEDAPFAARARRNAWQELKQSVGPAARNLLGLAPRLPDLARAWSAFEDGASRALFVDLLTLRHLSPHLSGVTANRERHHGLIEFMSADLVSEPIADEVIDILGNRLALFSYPFAGRTIRLITNQYYLYWSFANEQYHFERGALRVAPEPGDVMLDCGCYAGESSVRFALDVGPSGAVYAFEPARAALAIASENARLNDLSERIHFVGAGVGAESNAHIAAAPSGSGSVPLSAGRRLGQDDPVVSIDDFAATRGLAGIDFIKMDVEGSELAALRGATATIAKHKPKLAISLYHRPADLWELTNYIKRQYPFYRLWLAHHSLHLEETVLYARAK